jgi:cytoskeletal protein RodZ
MALYSPKKRSIIHPKGVYAPSLSTGVTRKPLKKGSLKFMNLTFHIVALVVLIAVVAGLYLYHRWLENHDDPYIHLHNDAHDSSIISTQTSMAKRLDQVDKLKNAGIVAVILYALAIAGMAVYVGWNSNAQV